MPAKGSKVDDPERLEILRQGREKALANRRATADEKRLIKEAKQNEHVVKLAAAKKTIDKLKKVTQKKKPAPEPMQVDEEEGEAEVDSYYSGSDYEDTEEDEPPPPPPPKPKRLPPRPPQQPTRQVKSAPPPPQRTQMSAEDYRLLSLMRSLGN